MKGFKIGQMAFVAGRDEMGWFSVLNSNLPTYPLLCGVDSYTTDGRLTTGDRYPTLHHTDFEGNGPPKREIDWEKIPKGHKTSHDGYVFLAHYNNITYVMRKKTGEAFISNTSRIELLEPIPDSYYKEIQE